MSLALSAPAPRAALRYLLWILATIVGLILLLPLPAWALDSKAFGTVVVEPGQWENEVSTVIGDVDVKRGGTVDHGVRSGFGDVTVRGPVGGKVKSGFGDIEVHAPVGGIDAGFGDVYINAPVSGDVDVDRGDLTLGPDAVVPGDVTCENGEVVHEPGAPNPPINTGMTAEMDNPFDFPGLLGLLGWLFAALGFVACAVLATVLAPGPFLSAARRLETDPVRSFVFGLGAVLAGFVLAVALAVSIIGIPLLLLLIPALLALVFAGSLVSAYEVGRRALLATGRYRAGNAFAAALGAGILAIAGLLPFVGVLLVYGLALLGTGAAVMAIFARFSRRRSPPAPMSYEDYVRDRRA